MIKAALTTLLTLMSGSALAQDRSAEPSIESILSVFSTAVQTPDTLIQAVAQITDGQAVTVQRGADFVILDLVGWVGPYGAIHCIWFDQPLPESVAETREPVLGDLLHLPLLGHTKRRVTCSYTHWDPLDVVRPKADTALDWAQRTISETVQSAQLDDGQRYTVSDAAARAKGGIWAIQIEHGHGSEDEAILLITTVMEVMAATS